MINTLFCAESGLEMSASIRSTDWRYRRNVLVVCLGMLIGCKSYAISMEEEIKDHKHHHHAMMEANSTVKRSEANYTVPTIKLVRNDGVSTPFRKEVDDGRPVILEFMYTSCTDICPMTSLVLSQVQRKLDKNLDKVHIVSISIDPEFDTPERLAAFAKKYGAGPEWQHYTGTLEQSVAMQQAFDAYRGDKMNHAPLTLIRPSPGKPWIRLDGFASPDDIIDELPQLVEN